MPITSEDIIGINYSSINNAGTGFRALSPEASDVGPAVTEALNLSYTRGYRLTRGILDTVNDEVQYEEEVGNLITWAKAGGSQERQIVAKAIRNDGGRDGNLFLVHSISGMPKTDARAFMQDYFDAGGDTKAVTDWLAIAGQVLRQSQGKSTGTAGIVVDAVNWVVDRIEDAVDAIVEAIEAIVDAIITAGRALVDIVGDVISWTIEAVGDLVTALIEVGESIGDILVAAWEFSAEALTKFARAVIDIGREIGELFIWAVGQAVDVLRTVIEAVVDGLAMIGQALVWAVTQTVEIAGQVVQALIDVGRTVVEIVRSVITMAADIVRAVVEALIEIGRTVGELIVIAFTQPQNFFRALVQGLIDIGQTIANLFDEVITAVADGVQRMARALIELGKDIVELVAWAIDKAADIIKDVIKGILDAGKLVLDLFTDLAAQAVAVIKKVVQALFDIGRTILNLMEDIIQAGIEFARKFFQAITEMVGGLIRFAQEIVRLTYSAAAQLVESLMEIGITVAELLGTVIGASYWAFRRILNGIIQNLGPVGDVLDFILTQVENAADELWRRTLLALRFAQANLVEAIEWAANATDDAFEAVLNAWENIEEDLIDFYQEVAQLASQGVAFIFERLGRATVRLENSVTYVLNFLENDALPGIRDFIKGVMDAGYELASLFVNIANITLVALTEVVTALLDIGITLTEMLTETMKNPEDLLENFLQAIDEAGQTLNDLFQSAIVDTGEQYLEAVVITLVNLERPLLDMLNAVAEVLLGAIGTVFGILFSTLATYRPMTADEIATAQLVYGNTFDYSRIFFAQESLSNDIIFGVQDFVRDNPNSREFVTNTLVNFDVNDGQIDNDTMIHELCHVWQFEETGPFYMAEALHAQIFGEGYSYGYDNDNNGNGGEDDLIAAINDNPGLSTAEIFELFNREQQAEIVMHYYVRLFEESPALDIAPWQPFRDVVFS